MNEFKANYTTGIWEVQTDGIGLFEIYDENNNLLCEVWNGDNANVIAKSPKMAEYMMGRAKKLSEEISYSDSVADHFELIGHMEPEKREELQTILSILKNAGVEVVEK